MAMMCFILTFSLQNINFQSKNYKLVYYLCKKLLLLKDVILYVYKNSKKDSKVVNAPKILEKKKTKNVFIIFLPQLFSGIYNIKNFCNVFVKFSKYLFNISPNFSDINDIYCHVYAIILLKKKFDFFFIYTF